MLDKLKSYLQISKNKNGSAYLGLVHRIDRPCSGVVVFAKTSKSAARLGEVFRDRTAQKDYVCVVNGILHGQASLHHTLLKTSAEKVRVYTQPNTHDEKQHCGNKRKTVHATLQYRSLHSIEVLGGRGSAQSALRQTLLHVSLGTGRKHQIRAQMQHIGHPIVGDIKYGAPQSFSDRAVALHACSLVFNHPITRQKMRFSAPVPAIWEKRFGAETVQSVDELILSLSMEE